MPRKTEVGYTQRGTEFHIIPDGGQFSMLFPAYPGLATCAANRADIQRMADDAEAIWLAPVAPKRARAPQQRQAYA